MRSEFPIVSYCIVGILQEEYSDVIHSSLEPIVGAGHPAQTWSGSSL